MLPSKSEITDKFTNQKSDEDTNKNDNEIIFPERILTSKLSSRCHILLRPFTYLRFKIFDVFYKLEDYKFLI